MAIMGVTALVVLAATAAQADNLRIFFASTFNTTNTGPTATTGGLVFLNTGSGPVLWNNVGYDDPNYSPAHDLNIELLAGTTPTNLAHIAVDPNSGYVPYSGYTLAQYTSILLRDVGTGGNPPSEVPNAGNYDMCWFSDSDPSRPPGTFMDYSTFDEPYVIPNSDGLTGAYLEIRMWTGSSTTYPTYAAARAAAKPGGPYVADSGVIYRGLQSSQLLPPSYLGDVMPAMILGIPSPEPSTLLLAASGLVGLLAYAWKKRR
jgi:hypothetical protein